MRRLDLLADWERRKDTDCPNPEPQVILYAASAGMPCLCVFDLEDKPVEVVLMQGHEPAVHS